MSHLPDDIERDQNLRFSIGTALENVYGPRQWDATIALIAEGEAEAVDWPTHSDGEPDGMTLEEIGDHYGLSRERARGIIQKALWKLRQLPLVREMFLGYRHDNAGDIDAALRQALEDEEPEVAA